MSLWRKLWIAWSIAGLGSLAVMLAFQAAGHRITPAGWVKWAVPALGSFAVLEIWGLIRKAKGDTFSEMVWDMRTARSIVLFACAWGMVALATGNIWPSFGVFALGWCLWHFWKEGPYAEDNAHGG